MILSIIIIIISVLVLLKALQTNKEIEKTNQQVKIMESASQLAMTLDSFKKEEAHLASLSKFGDLTMMTFESLKVEKNRVIKGFDNLYIYCEDRQSKQIFFVCGAHKEFVHTEQIIGVEILIDNYSAWSWKKQDEIDYVGFLALDESVKAFANTFSYGKTVSSIYVRIVLANNDMTEVLFNCFDCKLMSLNGLPMHVNEDNLRYIYQQCLFDAENISDAICEFITHPHVESDSEQAINRSITDNPFQGFKDILLKKGKLEAIKIYKDYANCSLKEACEFIDSL